MHSQPGFESERLWAAGGVTPLRKRNLGSIDAVCELVNAQAGISILSRWGVYRQIDSGSLKAIQATEQGLDISWRAIVSNRMPDEAAGRSVLESLRDWFSETDA